MGQNVKEVKKEMNKFSKKVVVVTGGSSGIGFETAKLFREKGSSVIILTRGKKKIEDGWKENFFKCDVSKIEQVEKTIEKIMSEYSRIDIVVNAAGIFEYNSFEDSTLDELKGIWEINFLGIVNVCNVVLPYMIKQGSGHIVNIASTSAYMEIPKTAMYSASKSAVRSFSNALRMDVEKYGVNVSVVSPGYTRTNLFDGKFSGKLPIFYRFPTVHPKIPAKSVLKAVEKNKREIIVGIPENIVIKILMIFPRLGYYIVRSMDRLNK